MRQLEILKSKILYIINNPLTKKMLLAFYLILGFIIIYHLYFAQRIIPGVKIGGVNVGGLSYDQAKNKLQTQEQVLVKDLVLKDGGKEYVIRAREIGLVYDWESSISRAYEIGRTGNFIIDNKDKLAGLVKNLYIPAFYDYEDNALSNKFALVKGEINHEAEDAHIVLENNEYVIKPSTIGRVILDQELYEIVINSFDRMDYSSKEIPVKQDDPKVFEADVRPLFDQAQKIISNKIIIKLPDEVKNVSKNASDIALDKNKLIEFLAFGKEEGEIVAKLNKPKFQAFIDTLAQDINKLPRGKVTKTDGIKVVDFEITAPGREIDQKKFDEEFRHAFLLQGDYVKQFEKEENIILEIPMKDTTVENGQESYGIYALLGEGKSKFSGSIPARIKNLTLAAERTSGVLVPPNGIYSMNNTIGEISGLTGYDAAYIIKNGRTVLGEGGGVCQTSTTLFRAVLNSGLPVVARYPHAYRVRYYELESAVGLDASIFQPTLDFQFKNDTSNYVLVQADWNLDEESLTFYIYGTPDGRKVEIPEPVLTNQIAPAAPAYIDDPTLAKDKLVQVEWPAWGGTAIVTRIVTRDGEILHDDTFTTRYQPWRAVYLKGTKE